MPCANCRQQTSLSILVLDVAEDDWRSSLIKYLSNLKTRVDKKTRYQALNYVILGDDFFKRTQDSLVLLCIGELEQMQVMAEVHESICGAHQASEKMR